MSAHIRLQKLVYHVHLGASKRERSVKQQIYIDLKLWQKNGFPNYGDDLKNVVNYAEVAEHLEKFFQNAEFKLLESLSRDACASILVSFLRLKKVKIRVAKFNLTNNGLPNCHSAIAVFSQKKPKQKYSAKNP